MRLRLLYHGHCFDGVASAAVFTRFYRSHVDASADVAYAPLLHTAGSLFDEAMFDGDENAIVDFKYSPSGRLTWWFDHHQSAFLSAEDEAHFRADRSGRKFWDPESKSCTEFIARVADENFGFRDDSLVPLISWAHTIDGAFYESAAQPVELREPALQLMQVIENVDDAFIEWVIRQLSVRTLEEVATGAEAQERFRPLLARHRETLETVRRKAAYERGAVTFDLVDEGLEGFNKFIPYYVHPETTYSVAVTRGAYRAKISVGSNPFSPRPRRHNIASICERYGGGGHAVVGAVSFRPDEVERARQVAREILAELREGFEE
ncbi:MAG: phosphoesterase [Acidobacteria bacterium]|nr:phosphoesterase [Acidobacteriota bacterium]MCA1619737.1 phosphoesterase [Acidobacteriota bacterium]